MNQILEKTKFYKNYKQTYDNLPTPYDWEIQFKDDIKFIKQFNFEVLDCRVLDKNNKYNNDEYKRVYFCKYKEYNFEIIKSIEYNDFEDKQESCFKILKLKYKDIEYDYSVILTHKNGMNNFIKIIDIGLEQYLYEKYKKYKSLPEFFRKNGYNVECYNWQFNGLQSNIAYFMLNNKIQIRLSYDYYFTHMDSIEIRYNLTDVEFIDYQIDKNELLESIKKIEAKLNAPRGYFENNVYYDEKYLNRIFKNEIEHEIKISNSNNLLFDDVTYYYENENLYENDIRNEYDLYIKYDLLYNYKQINETLAQNYMIAFYYDKEIDIQNCIVNIEHKILKLNGINMNPIEIQDIEFKGTFLQCVNYVLTFIKQLLNILELDMSNELKEKIKLFKLDLIQILKDMKNSNKINTNQYRTEKGKILRNNCHEVINFINKHNNKEDK